MNPPEVTGDKRLDCLTLASLSVGGKIWQDYYAALCCEYSEKAVCARMERLERGRYLDCGVSARTGWLTEKGCEALGVPPVYGWKQDK